MLFYRTSFRIMSSGRECKVYDIYIHTHESTRLFVTHGQDSVLTLRLGDRLTRAGGCRDGVWEGRARERGLLCCVVRE